MDYVKIGEQYYHRSTSDIFDLVLDADATAISIRMNETQTNAPIKIKNNADTTVFSINPSVTTGNAIDLTCTSLTEGKAIDLSDLSAITTGKAIHIDATGVTQTDGILVHIDSASTALTSTGRLLLVDHTGNAGVSTIIAEVKSAATDETTVLRVTASAVLAAGVVLDVSAAAMTTGTAIDVGGLDALTSGIGVNVVSNSADATARSLVYIKNDNTAAVLATPLTIVNDAVVGTGSKFKIAATLAGKSIWVSTDGTSPHGVLGATQDARVAIGDICLGVTASAAGKIAYCVDNATNGTWQVITSA